MPQLQYPPSDEYGNPIEPPKETTEQRRIKELEERVRELENYFNDKKKKHPYSVVFNGYERVLSKEDYETMEEHLHHL